MMNWIDTRALVAALLLFPACGKSDDSTTESASETHTSTVDATHGADASSGSGSGSATEPTSFDATTLEPTGPASDSATAAEETSSTGGAGLDCDSYCAAIATNCTGAETQYSALANCMATCATFPPGTAADMGGNTLGCRSYHAGAALADPTTHCVHAGPGGAGVCGGNCESFCLSAAQICPDAWPDTNACETACATFSPDEKYDATDVSGNTFACRLYHLTAASVDAADHCPHIKGDSASRQ